MPEVDKGDCGRPAWLAVALPRSPYMEIWRLQAALAAARREGTIDRDVVLFLEHLPVFTLGRRGGRENLKVPESFLDESKIPIVHVERGGSITYHGPGQIVVYPIIDLKNSPFSVIEYVTCLEEVMIRTLAAWGIPAERNRLNRGVWVNDCKIGSLGVAIRRGVSFHGFSLNVSVSMEPFKWMHPCGLKDVGVTSMSCELAQDVPVAGVLETMKKQMSDVFHVNLIPAGIDGLLRKMEIGDQRPEVGCRKSEEQEVEKLRR
ncbi:MAG: lipoyl(octanoyl) transferase LipB [Desulfobacteraceae bacterium]|nr:MAG: lipoyl(octanoyl) transferase LipB [Desulfobacteraceae bacterium]